MSLALSGTFRDKLSSENGSCLQESLADELKDYYERESVLADALSNLLESVDLVESGASNFASLVPVVRAFVERVDKAYEHP